MNTTLKRAIAGKTILITGGTGSFGNTVTRQLLPFRPKKIIIFSRDEKKQFDMRNTFDNPLLRFVIGDVRDLESIQKAMVGVDYVFHAAAMKQVPTSEFFPMEAVKTNVIGTQHVLAACRYHGVKRVVVLSTDKAVYPINVLGLTKALMEKVMISEAKSFSRDESRDTVFCGVRYGNVLYTRGSVLPYFVERMREGKQLLLTQSEMTRFLLPLDQAVDLVLYALTRGENGYLYVRKSPAATIETLAQAMCEIFQYEKGYTAVGIRAGEKIHETLVSEEELVRAQESAKYYKIPPESQGLDYATYFRKGHKENVREMTSFTSENTERLNVKETIAMLKKVPEIQRELKRWKNL